MTSALAKGLGLTAFTTGYQDRQPQVTVTHELKAKMLNDYSSLFIADNTHRKLFYTRRKLRIASVQLPYELTEPYRYQVSDLTVFEHVRLTR